eukprot:5022715-Ditylum_brightwellii.AAC.1
MNGSKLDTRSRAGSSKYAEGDRHQKEPKTDRGDKPVSREKWTGTGGIKYLQVHRGNGSEPRGNKENWQVHRGAWHLG